MKRDEAAVFWYGLVVLVLCLNISILPVLVFLAWYVKRIPEKRLPLSIYLASNQKKFYDWLSDFFLDWFKSAGIPIFIAIFLLAVVWGGFSFAPMSPQFSLLNWLTHPVFGLLLGYLLTVILLLTGFSGTKYLKWDMLFDQAETTARMLVGNEEYDIMTVEEKNHIKRNVVDSLVGINKATIVVAGGKIHTYNPPAGDLARFGGPGVLIVQEGHAVVLERGGRRSRIVGTGVWQLGMFERVNMVIPLMPRSIHLEVDNVVTQDHVVVSKIKLLAFTKLDIGDESHQNGDYPFDDKIINDLVWSPHDSPEVYDWAGIVKSVAGTSLRDLVARLTLDDLVLASGPSRERLRKDLKDIMNRVTKDRLGVVVNSVVLGEIIIPDEARKTLLQRWLAEVNRRTTLINADAEREKLILKGEGEAQSMRRIGLAKTAVRNEIIKLLVDTITETSKTGSPIADPNVAVRYVAAIEKLSALVVQQDNTAAFEYISALERLCESPSARTIILGDTRSGLRLPGMGQTET